MRIPICRCAESAGRLVRDMAATDDHSITPLISVKRRGKPWWWLGLSVCAACGQEWLAASEEMQNDVECLQKLDRETARRIRINDLWPADFDRYETLLEMGREAGHLALHGDATDNWIVSCAIRELAAARPGITVPEIASLLNLELPQAFYLAQKAIDEHGLVIGNGEG